MSSQNSKSQCHLRNPFVRTNHMGGIGGRELNFLLTTDTKLVLNTCIFLFSWLYTNQLIGSKTIKRLIQMLFCNYTFKWPQIALPFCNKLVFHTHLCLLNFNNRWNKNTYNLSSYIYAFFCTFSFEKGLL